LKDSECDPGWAETIEDYLEFFGEDGRPRQIPYVRFRAMDDFVYDVLPPDATVAVIGDWGTGMAPAVRLLEQLARHQPHALVHLGDIYYAGTPNEVKQHFVDLVNRILDRARTPASRLRHARQP
jgi:phosphodiesterase/alkaline phosphatase D-like protein